MSPNPDLVSRGLQLERRAVVELRADGPRIIGHAIVFDTPSRDLGGFREVVRRQAVERRGDVVCLFNHDPAAVLGRTPATLRLDTDARGLAFTLDPAPTQAGRDALALVTRGDVTGASFGFTTTRDAWHKDAGGMLRELLDIELKEISLTAFPAYAATDVSIAQRSLQAANVQRAGQSIAWLRMRER